MPLHMADLFSETPAPRSTPRPLADRMRPTRLQDVVGQDHLLSQDGPLARMLTSGHLPSLILWGPPGVGKTSIARLLADETALHFEAISAIFSGVKDLRTVFDAALQRQQTLGQGTLLFVDEIHRFNRTQQDGFLPYVETGLITLVGATTENPSFELNGALLSRCTVLTLNRLDNTAANQLIDRAEAALNRPLPLAPGGRDVLIRLADGDGRYLLNLVEQVFTHAPPGTTLSHEQLGGALQQRAPSYDKNRDGHYGLISALHKSVRGSDPDAALYWLARMIEAGEDPLYLARRLIRMASEDIGLADPTALMIANEAARSFERLGSPEGDLALAHAVVHLATAPKSNAVYVAWKAARDGARQTGSLPPPKHLQNAPTDLMKAQGYGAGYIYDHDTPEAFAAQNHFPEGMARNTYYAPAGRGREGPIAERLRHWQRLRDSEKQSGREKPQKPD